MHESNGSERTESDPLAEIIRAAGRRKEPPQEHYDQVYAAARAAWRGKLRTRRSKRWYAIAASIAVMGIAGVLVQRWQVRLPEIAGSLALIQGSVEIRESGSETWAGISGSGLRLQDGARLRTDADGAAVLDLATGGSMRLAQGTEIVVATDTFELVSGRLYFDSYSRPPTAAIRVATPFGTVTDIGTQFEVSLSADSIRVRVREGAITVADGSSVVTAASAGEQLQRTLSGNWERERIAADAPEWSWAEELARVSESETEPVVVYLRWIARETGKQLEFESPLIELQAETSTLSSIGNLTGMSPRKLLESIPAITDFSYELTDDGAILIGRN